MSKVRTFASGFKEGFGDFGMQVANVVNFILLSAVYVIGVGITSVAAKIVKKRFIDTTFDRKRKSYYVIDTIKKKGVEEYYRQF